MQPDPQKIYDRVIELGNRTPAEYARGYTDALTDIFDAMAEDPLRPLTVKDIIHALDTRLNHLPAKKASAS